MKFITKTKLGKIKSVLISGLLFINFAVFAQVDEKEATEEKKIEPPQESKFEAEFGIVYPNLSRGILLNTERLAYQFSASYDITKRINFGVWVTTNFSNDSSAYNEYDLTLGYQFSPVFTLELGDYYTPATKYANIEYGEPRTPYFDYSIYSSQVVELCLLFDFTPKGFPLDFQWDTVIYGNDFKDVVTDSNGNVISKKRAFSSYSEVGYTYNHIGKFKFQVRPFVGAAVINDAGYYGYYRAGNTGFAFINVGITFAKNLIIFKKEILPIFIQYTYNEDGNYADPFTNLQYSYFSAGIFYKLDF